MAEHVSGYHAIEETLKKRNVRGTLFLSRSNERIEQLRELAERSGVAVSEVGEGELTRLSGSPSHKGALLVVEKPSGVMATDLKEWLSSFSSEAALVLALDHITDPQNLGAILRSADQFTADMVLLPSRRSAQETQTVAKVSSGTSAYVPLLVVSNLATSLELLKKNGFWIYGADMAGERVDRADLRGRVCLVMGNEGEGLHRLVKEKCDVLLRIPSAGHVDSFNVSAAAAILMYETRRQQGFPS